MYIHIRYHAVSARGFPWQIPHKMTCVKSIYIYIYHIYIYLLLHRDATEEFHYEKAEKQNQSYMTHQNKINTM